MRRRRHQPQTWEERYTPRYLAALDAMDCHHDEPKGARYCPLCRHTLSHLQRETQ